MSPAKKLSLAALCFVVLGVGIILYGTGVYKQTLSGARTNGTLMNVTVGVGSVVTTTQVVIGKYPDANRAPTAENEGTAALYAAQTNNVNAIQGLLSTYHDLIYRYPDQLAGALEAVVPVCQADQRRTHRSCPDPQSISFVDAYTGKPFPYLTHDDEYVLQYVIHFPDAKTATDAPFLVEGENALTSKFLSVYSIVGRRQQYDRDHDGLIDDVEKVLGSDPSIVDSDHDGFSDYDEIIRGYNPTGSGTLMLPAGFDFSTLQKATT